MNIKVHLAKRAYGRLRVTVVDADGRPVPGARVFPASAVRQFEFRKSSEGEAVTSERGVARLKKIPAGPVRLKVDAYGRYLDEAIVAKVDPKEERHVKATMLSGMTVRGRVALPKGTAPPEVWVKCQLDEDFGGWTEQSVRTVRATRKGGFEIPGLAPGTYQILALAPGWCCPNPARAVLNTGDAPPEATVSLVRSGGFKLDFGSAYRGSVVSMMKPGDWKPSGAKFEGSNVYAFGSDDSHCADTAGKVTLDAFGRGGLFGVSPGTFDFIVALRAEDPGRSAVTSRVVLGVRVPSFEGGWDEWRKTPPLQMRPAPAKCEARCRVRLKAGKRKLFGNFKVVLAGKEAFSESPYFWFQGGKAPWSGLHVVGEPPVRSGHGFPVRIRFRGLPDGAYQLLVRHDTELWLPDAVLEKNPSLKEPLKKLEHARVVPVGGPVRLSAGNVVDLGRVELDVPPGLQQLKERVERLLKAWQQHPE
jgi:hypothetical protein